MPHGIVLLATLKNNDNCYLLFKQPSSSHFHAIPCVSSSLWFPSHDLLVLTKSIHGHFSPRLEGSNISSSSSSYLRSWCSPHNLCFVTKSPVCRLSSRIPQALILSILNSENFDCRNGVLATNIINTASAPHLRCQHPTKGALLLAPSNGLATFLALLLIAVRHHLLTTSSRLPSQHLTRHLWESHHLLALSKSVYHSKCCNAASCASPMLMHFSRLPRIYQVLSL